MGETWELARQYGRYGYRKIAGLLEQAGWIVNDKRVERIWRREGLKVPHKQPKRGRLWLTDGSCLRLRPEHRNHVWSYDFVEDRTHDGRKYRMLNVIDEFSHECLVIRVARKLKAIDVIDVLSDLFILRGIPGHIRSDNGPEFVAKAVPEWITAVGAKTAYIAPGSPWENGYVGLSGEYGHRSPPIERLKKHPRARSQPASYLFQHYRTTTTFLHRGKLHTYLPFRGPAKMSQSIDASDGVV